MPTSLSRSSSNHFSDSTSTPVGALHSKLTSLCREAHMSTLNPCTHPLANASPSVTGTKEAGNDRKVSDLCGLMSCVSPLMCPLHPAPGQCRPEMEVRANVIHVVDYVGGSLTAGQKQHQRKHPFVLTSVSPRKWLHLFTCSLICLYKAVMTNFISCSFTHWKKCNRAVVEFACKDLIYPTSCIY